MDSAYSNAIADIGVSLATMVAKEITISVSSRIKASQNEKKY